MTFSPSIIESARGHRLMSTDHNEEHECHESCLTCGGMWVLRDRDGDGKTGVLEAANGDPADECTYNTDMVHGYPGARVCERDGGTGCKAWRELGSCSHVDVPCNCLHCA